MLKNKIQKVDTTDSDALVTPNKSSSVFKYSESDLANRNTQSEEEEFQHKSDDEDSVDDAEIQDLAKKLETSEDELDEDDKVSDKVNT